VAPQDPRRGPGPVAPVHRIFIASALACALAYAAWGLRQYARSGAGLDLALVVLAVVAAAGIAVYLWSLRGLAARLTPRSRDDAGPRRP